MSGHSRRVLRKYRGVFHNALFKTYAVAVFQIYGGNDQHMSWVLGMNMRLSISVVFKPCRGLLPACLRFRRDPNARSCVTASSLLPGFFQGETGLRKYYPLQLRK